MAFIKDQVSIRAYKPEDKNSLLEILRLNTPKYFAPQEEKDLIHYLDHEIDYYFVIEYNSTVVGSGGINFSEDKSAGKISWDILHPEFQGKSLGSLLLNYRIEKLKSFKGIKTITVRTTQLVYKFYEKSGFELFEVIKDYWAKGFDLYSMKYKL